MSTRIIGALALVLFIIAAWHDYAYAADVPPCEVRMYKSEGVQRASHRPATGRTYAYTSGGTNYPGSGAQNTNLRCDHRGRFTLTLNRRTRIGAHANHTASMTWRNKRTGSVLFLQVRLHPHTQHRTWTRTRPNGHITVLTGRAMQVGETRTFKPRQLLRAAGYNPLDWEQRGMYIGTETSGGSTIAVNYTITRETT